MIDSPVEVAQRLIEWLRAHQRVLPWRAQAAGARDPYAVWVAEMMLQQTRVAVVEGYFARWMARFPDLAALAAADQQEALKLWEGLGYYARARNLHKAAQVVMAQHGGVVPAERAALLALPGIGEYTAGAILSLAYGQPAPLLDGNVKRVLSRVLDIAEPIEAPPTVRMLWQAARTLVEAAPAGEAGLLNEALMELGALICTPRKPRCMVCPIHAHCLAFARGTQDVRPVRVPKQATPHFDVAAGVIWQGAPFASKLLITQRPTDGLLGGLWEFPGGKQEAHDADLRATLRREIREELAIEIEVGELITTVAHAFTHFRITLHAYHARHSSGAPQALGVAAWQWVAVDELRDYPMGKADRVVVGVLEGVGASA